MVMVVLAEAVQEQLVKTNLALIVEVQGVRDLHQVSQVHQFIMLAVAEAVKHMVMVPVVLVA